MFNTPNWAKVLIEVCGGWWSAMSGVVSIPLALLGFIFGGTPGHWFVLLAFVGLWCFAARVWWKNYQIIIIQKPERDRELFTKIVDFIKSSQERDQAQERPSYTTYDYSRMMKPAESIGALIKFIDQVQNERDLEWLCCKLEESGYQPPLKTFKQILDSEINQQWLPVLTEARVAPQEIKTEANFLTFLALNWTGKEKWRRAQARIQGRQTE
jgi:hypothetical protein